MHVCAGACSRSACARCHTHPDCHHLLLQRALQFGTCVCARVCDHCPARSCTREDRRTEGAGNPGQESDESHGKQQTLPAPCLSSCQLPADAVAAGVGGRAAAAGLSCAAWQARGTGRASPCLDPSDPPALSTSGLTQTGRHEAQLGATAPQTSRQSLRRVTDLSGCQDMVVFGIAALPDDPAEQTGHRAESCHPGKAVACYTAQGTEMAEPGGGLGMRGGQGVDGTLHGTCGTEGTWPEHGVAAMAPAQPSRQPQMQAGRWRGIPGVGVLDAPRAGSCLRWQGIAPCPPLRGVFICEVILKCKKINREQMGQGARAAPSPVGPLRPCWENTAAGEANGFQTCGNAGTCGCQDTGPDPAGPWQSNAGLT